MENLGKKHHVPNPLKWGQLVSAITSNNIFQYLKDYLEDNTVIIYKVIIYISSPGVTIHLSLLFLYSTAGLVLTSGAYCGNCDPPNPSELPHYSQATK